MWVMMAQVCLISLWRQFWEGFCSSTSAYIIYRTSAKDTSAMNCMHQCLCKTIFQNYCPDGEIAFSNSGIIKVDMVKNALLLMSL